MQKAARRQISDELRRAIQLEATLEATAFKRQRKERRGYTNDRIENKRQVDVEMRRRAKQREFLNAVIAHAREFKNWHLENQNKMKKVTKQIVAQRARLEKREQERRERAEKDRLRALKVRLSSLGVPVTHISHSCAGQRRGGLPQAARGDEE